MNAKMHVWYHISSISVSTKYHYYFDYYTSSWYTIIPADANADFLPKKLVSALKVKLLLYGMLYLSEESYKNIDYWISFDKTPSLYITDRGPFIKHHP